MREFCLLLYLLVISVSNATAQWLFAPPAHPLTTVAGADWKLVGAGGPATDAHLGPVNGVAVDSAGNVYASTAGSCTVARISPAGTLTIVAGNGQCGGPAIPDGAPATNGSLKVAGRLAADAAGNLYIADGDRVRKVAANGTITTATIIGGLDDIAVDSSGNLYIVGGPTVLRVSSGGTVTALYSVHATVPWGCADPVRSHYLSCSTMASAMAVAVDAAGRIYLSISSSSKSDPSLLSLNLDGTTFCPWVVSNFAVSPSCTALVYGSPYASGLATDRAGNLYLADDSYSPRILKLDPNGKVTVVGDVPAEPPAVSRPRPPMALAADTVGNVYAAVQGRVWRLAADGSMRSIAGNGQFRFSGDGGPAAQAALYKPGALAFDPAGNLYIADVMNRRIRKIDTNGIITTVAGNGQDGSGGDGGPATKASLNGSPQLAVSADGTVYFSDGADKSGYGHIRQVSPGGIITSLTGTESAGSELQCAPDGAPALSATPSVKDVAVDPSGKLHFVDAACVPSRVRTIDGAGRLRTVAGSGSQWQADSAGPDWVRFDGAGNLYLGNWHRICQVDNDGNCRVIINMPFYQAAPPRIDSFAVDKAGNVFVAEDWPLTGQAHRISWLSPAGDYRVIDLTSNLFGNLSGLAPLAADSKGNLYFSDVEGNTVRRMAVPGYTGLPEPGLRLNLQPGFYIAEVSLAQGQRQGYWSMEVAPALGFAGGFIAGGAILDRTRPPGWAAFSLSRPCAVQVKLMAQVFRGGDPAKFSMSARLLDSKRNQIGTDQLGTTSLQFERALDAGFYIVEVRGGTDTLGAAFQIGISAEGMAGPAYAGGFILPAGSFGAFYLPQQQDVSIKASGTLANGPDGAGNLELRLLDANRNLVRSVP